MNGIKLLPIITLLACNISVASDANLKSLSKHESKAHNPNIQDFDAGGSESSEEIETYASPELDSPAISAFGTLAPQATGCTKWNVHGKHKYKWRHYMLGGYNKLTGSSDTSFANQDGSCGIPLTVDVLSVKGSTYPQSNHAAINKTGYNTSYVEDSDKYKWVGSGDTACGARVSHTATKNGVTWATTTSSGCGN